jgi:hypothetical protein
MNGYSPWFKCHSCGAEYAMSDGRAWQLRLLESSLL